MIQHLTWLLVLTAAGAASAQDGARGHWSGSIELPNQAMGVEVDLDKTAKDWVGSVSIPSQATSGLPLDAIAFSGGKWTFRMKGVRGDPTFAGTISSDGKTMTGEFTQGPAAFPFKLARTGEPKVEPETASPAVAKEFTGAWEGTLDAGQPLRLQLKIANTEAGATATMISLDQGGARIPVSAVAQKDATLTLDVKIVNGGYKGEINKEGTELTGEWTQNGATFPLKLKKAGGA